MFSRIFSEVKSVASNVTTTVKTAAANVKETVKSNIQNRFSPKTVSDLILQLEQEASTPKSVLQWLELLNEWESSIDRSDEENHELYSEDDHQPNQNIQRQLHFEKGYTFKQIFLRSKTLERFIMNIIANVHTRDAFHPKNEDIEQGPYYERLKSFLARILTQDVYSQCEQIIILIFHIKNIKSDCLISAVQLLCSLQTDWYDDFLRGERNKLQIKAEKLKNEAMNSSCDDTMRASISYEMVQIFGKIAVSLEKAVERRKVYSNTINDRINNILQYTNTIENSMAEQSRVSFERTQLLQQSEELSSQKLSDQVSEIEMKLKNMCDKVNEAEKVRDQLKIQLEKASQEVFHLQNEQNLLLRTLQSVREEISVTSSNLEGKLNAEKVLLQESKVETTNALELHKVLQTFYETSSSVLPRRADDLVQKSSQWKNFFYNFIRSQIEKESTRVANLSKSFANEVKTLTELVKEAIIKSNQSVSQTRENQSDNILYMKNIYLAEFNNISLFDIFNNCTQDRIAQNIDSIVTSLAKLLVQIDTVYEQVKHFSIERKVEFEEIKKTSPNNKSIFDILEEKLALFEKQYQYIINPLRNTRDAHSRKSSSSRENNINSEPDKLQSILNNIPKSITENITTIGSNVNNTLLEAESNISKGINSILKKMNESDEHRVDTEEQDKNKRLIESLAKELSPTENVHNDNNYIQTFNPNSTNTIHNANVISISTPPVNPSDINLNDISNDTLFLDQFDNLNNNENKHAEKTSVKHDFSDFLGDDE